METKQEVLAWAKVHDIEIIYSDKAFYKWVCAYAPIGQWFTECNNHEVSLWEGQRAPDWSLIGKDLMANSELAPCTLEVCEVCHE